MKSSREGAKRPRKKKKTSATVVLAPPRKTGTASSGTPRASRPNIPGYGIAGENEGRGLLPWSRAEERLTKSWNYWLATTRPDGRPHLMLVWGIWRDGAFWFSTGDKTVKARNLAANPKCVIGTERANDAVILEGVAAWTAASPALAPLWQAYKKKYNWDVEGSGFYRVHPAVAFGLIEKDKLFTQTATRWTFA